MFRTKKKGKKKGVEPLPRYVRGELRMACAMRGFSELKSGKPRRLNEQHEYMARFFHGSPPNYPSQIKLLCEGRASYRDLFEEVTMKSTKRKADIDEVRVLRLKSVFSGRDGRVYDSGVDIRWEDLEKKNRTGALLVGGRNLHDLATKGSRNYKKALAYSAEKWNDKLMEPKESGSSVEDVIEYVRKKMYLDIVGPKKKGGKVLRSDDESESEEIQVEENEKAEDFSAKKVSEEGNEKGDTEGEKRKSCDKGNGDGDEGSYSDDSSSSASHSDSDEDYIPADWMFPSFYVFVMWGPFVEPDKRLNISVVDDRGRKKGVGTRKQSRGKDVEEKRLGNNTDTSLSRGLTMDQRIEIQNLNVRHQVMSDRQREAAIVGFSVEEGMISRQLEQAERRAESRCPQYDATNVYWKKVDTLMEKQDGVLRRIEVYNCSKAASGFDANKEIFGVGDDNDGIASDMEYVNSPENSTPSPLKVGKPVSSPFITPVNLNVLESDVEVEEKAEDTVELKNDEEDDNEITTEVETKKKRKIGVGAPTVPPKKRVSSRSHPIRKTR